MTNKKDDSRIMTNKDNSRLTSKLQSIQSILSLEDLPWWKKEAMVDFLRYVQLCLGAGLISTVTIRGVFK